MGQKYDVVEVLNAFLDGKDGGPPIEVIVDVIREAIRTQDRILAMAPKSLEFAAPEERESMLEAISTVREEKGKLEVLLEKLLQMERDEKEDMEGLPAE